MLKLSFALGLRFFSSKRRAVLSRFMAAAATAGIAVGVFALIVGLSAMNGFERELENRVLSVIPSAQIKAQRGFFTDADGLCEQLLSDANISAAAPVSELEAVFSNGRDFVPAMLYGIEPSLQEQVTAISQYLTVDLEVLKPEAGQDSSLPVILGEGIVKRLALTPGEEFKLYISTSAAQSAGTHQDRTEQESEQGSFGSDLFKSPQVINLKLSGSIKIGGQLDQAIAFADLQTLLQKAKLQGPNQIQVKTASLLQAQAQAYRAASTHLTEPGYVVSWLSTQGKLYHDIQMVRGIMYLAMILVMAVACFNIVSNLIMAVSEKQREIAILLTMGAGRRLIVQSFCIMGLLSGLRGIVIGLVLGCACALWLTEITTCIEQLFGVKFLNEEIYFINFIPAELSFKDVVLVFMCALVMSLTASIYPAWKASKLEPAAQLNS